MGSIRVEGIEDLEKALRKNVTMDDVRKVVRHHGAELQDKMQKKANFTKGYQTGTTKRSVALVIEDDGLTAAVQPGTSYSPYVEYGTRYMRAQRFVRPAFDEQAPLFVDDMRKLVK